MDNLNLQLQKAYDEIARLKTENVELRKRLELMINSSNDSIQKVGHKGRKVTQYSLAEEKIQLFRSLFRGREDVYAVRWESQTGKSGYSPACANEWHPTLCKKPKIKCSQCLNRKLIPLSNQVIYDHLTGKKIIGLYPLLKDETCWFLAVDFDKNNWQKDVTAFLNECDTLNVPAYIERSRSGNGCHVWIFFEKAVSATLARKLGMILLSRTHEKRYQIGLDSYDRLFPNQDTLPKGGFGNLIALPLQRKPKASGNSVFVDHYFEPYPDQWLFLSTIHKMNLTNLNEIVHEYKNMGSSFLVSEKDSNFKMDYPQSVKLILKNGIYINKEGLSSPLVNQFIQLGTFGNPEFHKKQKSRLSTYGIPRKINCTEDHPTHIILPRGCFESVNKLLKDLSVEPIVENAQNAGTKVDVSFKGNLNPMQEEAIIELLNHKNGVLSATTGFGKTVVAASLIARRKMNTLVVVHRKQLIEQWKEQLVAFLDLYDVSIGQIGGGKNKPFGKIDIATIQSLNYRGEVKDVIKQYGQIIVDECHHLSAFTFEQVLKQAHAKYIYGLTATPTRKDGLHPIIFMQCGPIRYKVNAKQQAKVRPFQHIVIPKFTNFKSTDSENDKKIQKMYDELIKDDKRNDLVFDDVLHALEDGRSPMVITERLNHVALLEKKFTGFVKNLIVLTGGMDKNEEQKQLKKLKVIPDDEERLIIATGKYIGEGFDDSRLDTLFLTMPVSWKGTLNQYVGRLHRMNDNKQSVQVYDYVDHKEPIFQKMYEKRLNGYNTLGYTTKHAKSQTKPEQLKLF